jgi:hypothetical protein
MMDVVLHHAPNMLRDVEEVLLEMLIPGAHVNCSSIYSLAKRL